MAIYKKIFLIGVVSTIFNLFVCTHWAYAATASSAEPDAVGHEESSLQVALSEDETQARVQALVQDKDAPAWGVSNFARNHKGTARAYEGVDMGYRWPAATPYSMSVLATEDMLYAYISPEACEHFQIDITSPSFQAAFKAVIYALDDIHARGGTTLSSLDMPWIFTSEKNIDTSSARINFEEFADTNHAYTTARLLDGSAASDVALFHVTGSLESYDNIRVAAEKTFMQKAGDFLAEIDYRPLWVSLSTAGVGTALIFVFGLLFAWGSIRINPRIKGVVDTILTIPLVMPPTVVGFLLLLFFGRSTAVGRWLIAHGIDLVFTWQAAVIACAVVAFPLMYRTCRGAFENLDPAMLDAARTLGWSEWRIFYRLMVPLAWPSIAAGTILGFARAMGEFGATLFFAGNYAGVTQTIPIAIYFKWMAGQSDVALFWVVVTIAISFIVILTLNVYSQHTQKFRRSGRNVGQ